MLDLDGVTTSITTTRMKILQPRHWQGLNSEPTCDPGTFEHKPKFTLRALIYFPTNMPII